MNMKKYCCYSYLPLLLFIGLIICQLCCCHSGHVSELKTAQEHQTIMAWDSLKSELAKDSMSRDSVIIKHFDRVIYEKDKRIDAYRDNINGQITLWLSIIAAICTILPIAMSLKMEYDIRKLGISSERKCNERINLSYRQMKKVTKKVNDDLEQLEGKIKKSSAEQLKYEKRMRYSYILNLTTMLRILRDFTNKHRPIQKEVPILKYLNTEIKDNLKNYFLDKEISDTTKTEVVCLIEQVRALIYTYERFVSNNLESVEKFQNAKYGLCELGDNIVKDEYVFKKDDITELEILVGFVTDHIDKILVEIAKDAD